MVAKGRDVRGLKEKGRTWQLIGCEKQRQGAAQDDTQISGSRRGMDGRAGIASRKADTFCQGHVEFVVLHRIFRMKLLTLRRDRGF